MSQITEIIDTSTGEVISMNPVDQLPVAVANPLDLPAKIFTAALDRRRQNRSVLMNWIREALVEGTDYGRIHFVRKSKCQLASKGRMRECTDPAHWSKPSLFKPGAEKICGMLGVAPKYPTLADYERAVIEGRDITQVILRCEIEDASGRIVAHGVGARSLVQDDGDLNKALKMAEKSGHIDAALRLAGLSEVFTQDVEDMRLQDGSEKTHFQKRDTFTDNERRLNPDQLAIAPTQLKQLRARIERLKLDQERVSLWMQRTWNVSDLQQLTQSQFRELDGKLAGFKKIQNGEPIKDEDRVALADYCDEHGLDAAEIAKTLGKGTLGDLNQAEAEQAWFLAQKQVGEKVRLQPADYDPVAAERSYMEREEKAGRSGTRGT